MEANIKRLSMQVKFGADGDQELDLVQSRALSELVEHISPRDAENSRLRSELAAIRDAGDEEIDDVASKSLHSPNSFERHCFAERLAYIAKSRGARVRELEGKVECLKDSCLILEFFRPSLRASIESIIKHERHHLKRTDDEIRSGVAAGMRNAVGENSMDWIASLQSQIDSLTAERDEAIELLKLLVSFLPSYVMDDLRACSVCSAVDSIDTERTSGFKRILELTAK